MAVGVLTVAVVTLLAGGTVAGSKSWQDEVSLWRRICVLADRDCPAARFWTSERAGYYGNLSMALYNLEDYRESIDSALRAIAIDRRQPEAYMMAGMCYNALSQHDEALRQFENALKIAPNEPRVLANYGSQLLALDRDLEAVDLLKRATKLAPTNPHVHRNLGFAYEKLEMWDESCESHRRAVEQLPRDVLLRGHFALALQRAGRFDEAIKQWEFIIREAAGSPEADLAAEELSKLRKGAKP